MIGVCSLVDFDDQSWWVNNFEVLHEIDVKVFVT